MKFSENKGGSKAVWNFSENSSVLEAPLVPKSKHPKSCRFLRSVVNFRRESEANFERLNLVMQTGGGDLIMSNARRGKILKEIPLSFDAKANYPLWWKKKRKRNGRSFFRHTFQSCEVQSAKRRIKWEESWQFHLLTNRESPWDRGKMKINIQTCSLLCWTCQILFLFNSSSNSTFQF